MKIGNFIKIVILAVLIGGVNFSAEAAVKKSGARGKSHVTAKRKSSKAAVAKVVAGEIHEYGDFLKTQDFSIKKGDSVISIEYPIEGNPAILVALKDFISQNIPLGVDENYDKITYKFSENETPEEFLKKAISKYNSQGSLGMEGETIEQKISIIYANDNVLTIADDGYVYTGGAHGMPWEKAISLLANDGTMLSYDLLPPFRVMKPYIDAGLAKYADIPISELENYFSPNYEYPEEMTPYIDANGLNIQYGCYEIGPYAMGLPKAVVSFADARNVCSGKAQRFLE